jgi:hypothetical protein
MSHLPVCATCKRALRCKKNSYAVIDGNGLWHADLWECPGCDLEVVLGFAPEPMMEPYDPRFAALVALETRHYGPPLVMEE